MMKKIPETKKLLFLGYVDVVFGGAFILFDFGSLGRIQMHHLFFWAAFAGLCFLGAAVTHYTSK
jgi:hypothetical protein